MKAYKIFGSLPPALFLSWFLAQWWNSSFDPWCLHYFPKWADKIIYNSTHSLLSEDIGNAANQMDMLEVWFSSFILVEMALLTILFVYEMKSDKTASD